MDLTFRVPMEYCCLQHQTLLTSRVTSTAIAAAESFQSLLTVWDLIDKSPPGSTIPGSFQARTLEWVAIAFSESQPQLHVFVCLFVSLCFISSFFLELFVHSSPVVYWSPTDLGSSSLVSFIFAFSSCSWGSQGKNTEAICHSFLEWITFCQNSPQWPIHLDGPAWQSS